MNRDKIKKLVLQTLEPYSVCNVTDNENIQLCNYIIDYDDYCKFIKDLSEYNNIVINENEIMLYDTIGEIINYLNQK